MNLLNDLAVCFSSLEMSIIDLQLASEVAEQKDLNVDDQDFQWVTPGDVITR